MNTYNFYLENSQLAESSARKEHHFNDLNSNDCQRCKNVKASDNVTCPRAPNTPSPPPADPKFGPGCGDCRHSCHCNAPNGDCPTCGHPDCAHYAL